MAMFIDSTLIDRACRTIREKRTANTRKREMQAQIAHGEETRTGRIRIYTPQKAGFQSYGPIVIPLLQ